MAPRFGSANLVDRFVPFPWLSATEPLESHHNIMVYTKEDPACLTFATNLKLVLQATRKYSIFKFKFQDGEKGDFGLRIWSPYFGIPPTSIEPFLSCPFSWFGTDQVCYVSLLAP